MDVGTRTRSIDEVDGLDLRTATEAQLVDLRRRVARTGAGVLPGQHLGPEDLEELAVRLGQAMFTPGESPMPGRRWVFEVTNRGRTTPPRSVWHTDTSYVDRPPAISVLAALDVPANGGETIVLDQYEAAAQASADLLEAVGEVELLHVASRVADPDTAGDGAWHPVLQRHPVTGWPAFYLTARERLAGARRDGVPLPQPEGDILIDRIHRQATEVVQPARHRWRAGDVLILDNRCTLHAADHSAVDGLRTLLRVMVREAEAPRGPSPSPRSARTP